MGGRKRSPRLRIGLFLGLGAFLAATPGCRVDRGVGERLSEEERARAVAVGRPAAAALATGLVTELTRALEEQGPERAVEVCSTEALRLTEQIAHDLSPGMELKRVSFRNRNPQNAPDALEAAALRYFQELSEQGDSLPQEWVQADGVGGSRYYKPLFVADFCVQCHGSPEQISPAVQEILAERYPDDEALGYAEGDFRGLIRVSVPAEVAR
jgi:hypothetical protein